MWDPLVQDAHVIRCPRLVWGVFGSLDCLGLPPQQDAASRDGSRSDH